MTANGLWYQNKEAVRVLRQVRKEGAKLLHVVDVMRARNFLDITYQTMMQKVKMVDDAVAASEGRISAEDIIEKRLQDRPAKDQTARGGRRDIMSVVDFKNAVSARTQNECAAAVSDFRDILLHAKSQDMLLRGQEPTQNDVYPKTVRAYAQLLGGDEEARSPRRLISLLCPGARTCDVIWSGKALYVYMYVYIHM